VPYRGDATSFPLSFSQQRLWFVEELESDDAGYNICYAVRLRGALDIPLLLGAMNAVVKRHEALRTVFVQEEEMPVQKIEPARPLDIPVVALDGLRGDRREETARRLLHRGSRTVFLLHRWPLLGATLLRLGAEEHVLGLVLHHIISDGWSLKVLIRDLAMFYGAERSGGPPPAPLSVQYKDFTLWQRGLGEELEKQRRFWRRNLNGVPPFLDLPTDRPRPETQTFSGGRHPFSFTPEASAAIEALVREEEGVTQFMVLLAVFQCLAGHLARQESFTVSTPLSYRNRRELEGLIGFFVNTVLFRADLSGDPEVGELLGQVRGIVLEAQAHQDLPLEAVIREVSPGRVLHYSPFLQVSVNFIHSDLGGVGVTGDLGRSAAGATGLEMEDFEFDDATTALVELGLVVAHDGERFRGSLHYKTDLFEVSTIETLIEQYQQLLVRAAERPTMRLSELHGFLEQAQKERRLREQKRLQKTARPGMRRGRRNAVDLSPSAGQPARGQGN
jgi:hypothetical protein